MDTRCKCTHIHTTLWHKTHKHTINIRVCSSSCCGDLVPWKLNFLLLPLSLFKTFNQEGELSLYAESCIMFYHMHNIIHVTPHHAILLLCIAEVMHCLAFAGIHFYVMETPSFDSLRSKLVECYSTAESFYHWKKGKLWWATLSFGTLQVTKT